MRTSESSLTSSLMNNMLRLASSLSMSPQKGLISASSFSTCAHTSGIFRVPGLGFGGAALTSSWMSSSAAGLVSLLRLGRTCSQKYVIKRVEWTFFCRKEKRGLSGGSNLPQAPSEGLKHSRRRGAEPGACTVAGGPRCRGRRG